MKEHICYNEKGADYETNHDNVQLCGCPPHFQRCLKMLIKQIILIFPFSYYLLSKSPVDLKVFC